MGLRSDMIRLLTSSDVTRTDFRLFGRRIHGPDYRHIAESIRNGQIQIVQSSRMPTTLAAYQRELNCFTVGARPSDNLIVHEATHAINDWHGRSLSAAEDEGLAYVAQMVFLCRRNPAIQQTALTDLTGQRVDQSARMCGRNRRHCNTATIGYATVIAGTLRAGRTPSAELVRNFRQVLAADPNTVAPATQRVYNRIQGVEIPEEYLREVGGRLVTS